MKILLKQLNTFKHYVVRKQHFLVKTTNLETMLNLQIAISDKGNDRSKEVRDYLQREQVDTSCLKLVSGGVAFLC